MAATAVGALKRLKSSEQMQKAIEREMREREAKEQNGPLPLSYFKDPSNFSNPFVLKYMGFAKHCERLVESDSFNFWIIMVIITAGIIVGLQTYPQFENDYTIGLIDGTILTIFTFEVLLKIVAEACAPWRFFMGPERGWNIFDLLIVVLSMPFIDFGGGNSVKLLRLTRLMRVMKLLKKIPQLQMIVMGLLGGLRSIAYILILLFLVFYLYAILGFYAFSQNDPFHFGSVPTIFVTLFRISTLEDWTDIVYINYYGCDSEMWDSSATSFASFGICPMGSSQDQEGSRGLTVAYFVSFVVIAALVMLSLFVGAVTMSMTKSMAMMKMESELAERRRRFQKAKRRAEKEKLSKRNIDGSSLTPVSSSVHPEPHRFPFDRSVLQTGMVTPVSGTPKSRGIGLSAASESSIGLMSLQSMSSLGVLDNVLESDEDAQERLSPRINTVAGTVADCADASRPERSSLISFDAEQKDKVNFVLNVFGKSDARVAPEDANAVGKRRFQALAHKAVKTIKVGRRASSMLWNPFAAPAPRQEEMERVRAAFKGVWEGFDLIGLLEENVELEYTSYFKQRWARLSYICSNTVEHHYFGNFITFAILVASALVGLQTEEMFSDINSTSGQIVALLDTIVLFIFSMEILLKTVSERFHPWRYFSKFGQLQGWNIFDFVIVVSSLIPGTVSMLTMLRLLRLLRVLKLVKSLPALQVIIVALIGGLTSITYIGVILFLVFYVFAIISMILFQQSDPWHFGSLHISLFTLFRMATLDDWTDVMYINMFGCDRYGYTGIESMCSRPVGYGAVAALFFISFVLLGALVLMTLFIGVVTTSMEEATDQQNAAHDFNERLDKLKADHGISDKTMEVYHKLFNLLDLDGSGTIEEEELRLGLESIGKCPEPAELSRLIKIVDEDGSGEIDLLEFCILLGVLGKYKGGSVMYRPDFEIRKSILFNDRQDFHFRASGMFSPKRGSTTSNEPDW